jgi:hypothetical protein
MTLLQWSSTATSLMHAEIKRDDLALLSFIQV